MKKGEDLSNPAKANFTQEDVELEIRGMFTEFARMFRSLPGTSPSEKMEGYMTHYLERYDRGA